MAMSKFLKQQLNDKVHELQVVIRDSEQLDDVQALGQILPVVSSFDSFVNGYYSNITEPDEDEFDDDDAEDDEDYDDDFIDDDEDDDEDFDYDG